MKDIIYRHPIENVIVLLDEVNSMPSTWSIKELICDRKILGRTIPDNIQFICIMNPYREKAVPTISTGLTFVKKPKVVQPQMKQLVYQVNRSPESVITLAWDFGKPFCSRMSLGDAEIMSQHRTAFPPEWMSVSDEILFAENLVHWLIQSQFHTYTEGKDRGLNVDFTRCPDVAENDGQLHKSFFRLLMCALLKYSQEFLRTNLGDISCASLRDIHRTVTLFSFLMSLQQKLYKYDSASLERLSLPYFQFLYAALCSSFTLNYALQLKESARKSYFEGLRMTWANLRQSHGTTISARFLPLPSSGDIYKTFDEIAKRLCGCLIIDGMAMNEAMKENIMSLFCSIFGQIDTGIAQFIVGRPGTTK